MYPSLLHDIILDARTNHNKTFSDLVWGHNVSGKEKKFKEIIYDARQDRDFNYILAAEKNGILERKIIIGFQSSKVIEQIDIPPLEKNFPTNSESQDSVIGCTDTKPFKLKGTPKIEQMADLTTYALDTEKYFTDLLIAEISWKIDKEIIDNMKNELRKYRDKIINQDC